MNWGRAKTILIILFLVIDVFLFVLLSFVQSDVSFIKQKTIQETVSVLKNHEINIKAEQIPSERNKNINIKLENLLYEPELMAQRFLGKTYSMVGEDEKTVTYQNKEASLSVSHDEFLFQKKRDIKEIESYEETKNPLYKDLNKLGYDIQDIGLENYYIKDGKCYISAFHTFEKNRIRNSEILIVADGSGILSLSGKCYSVTDATDEKENLLDVTSVLINMIYDSKYHKLVVKEVELAYEVDFENENISQASAHPVYVVTDVDDNEYVFKAI